MLLYLIYFFKKSLLIQMIFYIYVYILKLLLAITNF